ncbi:MAG: adenosine kinase [Candidatus Thiosymbion ectosymbiont of Robbea hypermnestra]|nr:adenosine kinase [Candidatus Thiosymbion ectosymbiont of Robbea hypermnestra]
MRKYHVYGIGNALMDLEYQVTVEDLDRLRVDKGVMTLVDEQRQTEIMDYLAARQPRQEAGGSVANSIIAVGQFGGTGFFSGKVADDDLGQSYLDDLSAGGVDTNRHAVREAGHTGRCLVLVTPDSDRTMLTYLGVSGDLCARELVPEALRDADYFYTEGYLAASDSAHALSIAARESAAAAGVKTAISLSDPNLVTARKTGLLAMIGPGVDLLFANEAEAKSLADTQDLNTAVAFLKTIAREFAITRGPQGALIHDGAELIEIAPVAVHALDTLGAGDIFAGALLYGLTQGWDHRRAGNLAAAAAAKLVTKLGPRLRREEAQAVLRDFP